MMEQDPASALFVVFMCFAGALCVMSWVWRFIEWRDEREILRDRKRLRDVVWRDE